MEKKTLPNDLAYPAFKIDEDGKQFVDNNMLGLTKREYFAAMAMQGLTTNPEFLKTTNHITEEGYLKSLCESAVNSADALITELNKTP